MPTTFYQRSAMAMAIAACFPAAGYAAGVARVDFAVGNVTAQGTDGRTRPLTRGSEIQVGDTVNTQQGRAQLRFEDGAYMSLQPETAFKVEQFRFRDNGGGDDSIIMNLLKGGMRTITGLIGRANRSNYKFRTEVATIGIRGTEYAVRYTNSVEVFCAGGAIDIQNEGGTLVLGAGQGGFVQSPNQEPQRTDERPFLPPTAATGTTEATEQISPPVNPVQESLTQQALLTGKIEGNAAVIQNWFTFVPYGGENVKLDLDAQGRLTAFDAVEGVALGVGTAQTISEGNDGVIAWGRWINGVPTQNGASTGIDLATEGTLHYVVGLPVTNMPVTGVATYNMIGATTPSFENSTGITSAKLDSSSLKVDFGWSEVSLNFKMTVNGQLTAEGTSLIYGLSGSRFGSGGGNDLLLTNAQCGSASLSVNGFLAGAGASRAGMAYQLNMFAPMDNVSGYVHGAAAYQQTGALAPSAPAQ